MPCYHASVRGMARHAQIETLAHPTRLAHTQTWEKGKLDWLDWLEQLFQKTACSPV